MKMHPAMTRSDLETPPPPKPQGHWVFLQAGLHKLAVPFLWAVRLETSGRFVGSLVLADLILASLVLQILDGFRLGHHLDLAAITTIAACLGTLHLGGLTYVHRWRWPALRLFAVTLLAVLILPRISSWLGIPLTRSEILAWLVIVCPVQLLLHRAHRSHCLETPLEPLRWMFAAAAGAAAGFPFLTTRSVGTGDAYWYGNMVGDFVTQWRAGIFPVFVGQSDYAFNGAVSPVRIAPYLQHAAGIIDLLTLRTLPPTGLLNAVLFSSLLAAALTTYATLAALAKQSHWIALVLTWLALASPGVLAMAYDGDLFMSVCTLPYLPLVMFALWRTFIRPGTSSVCLLAAALAAVWLCHPPIAFWLTAICSLAQLSQFPAVFRRPGGWRSWLAGALLFAALTGFLFVSVATLGMPAAVAEPYYIIRYATEVFPAVLMPVSEAGNALSDYQLGWSLWFVFSVAVFGLFIQPRGFRFALVGGCALLLLLLFPIPGLMPAIWRGMPQPIVNLTNHWPMQRFWVLITFMVVFAGQRTFADASSWRCRRWLQPLLIVLLLPALVWSWGQAVPFTDRGKLNTASPTANRVAQLPQNRILTRYAYGPFPQMPPYFSHGYVDPLFENRLLDREMKHEIAANRRAVMTPGSAAIRAQGELPGRANDPAHTSFTLMERLFLEPNRRYALELEFAHPELSGSLVLGGTTIQQNYYLPDSAAGQTLPLPSTAFGSGPSNSPVISVRSSAKETEDFSLVFYASPALAGDIGTFGRYRLWEFDPARLPIVIESWTPYRARVNSSGPANLETPRLFLPGYAALVNGKLAPVVRSPSGLVAIPVSAGDNRVKLTYPGPMVLRFSYFFSLTAWVAFLLWRVRDCLRAGPSATGARIPAGAQ